MEGGEQERDWEREREWVAASESLYRLDRACGANSSMQTIAQNNGTLTLELASSRGGIFVRRQDDTHRRPPGNANCLLRSSSHATLPSMQGPWFAVCPKSTLPSTINERSGTDLKAAAAHVPDIDTIVAHYCSPGLHVTFLCHHKARNYACSDSHPDINWLLHSPNIRTQM